MDERKILRGSVGLCENTRQNTGGDEISDYG